MAHIIGDLQNKLSQSWQESGDDGMAPEVTDISTLAMNLSNQTEYNNELLEYIRDLEQSLQNSESYRQQLTEKHEALLENYRETSDRADDLYHKLQISSSLCDELSAQLMELRNDSTTSQAVVNRERENAESLTQQNQYLEKSNKELTERVHRLEGDVDAAHRFKKSILSDESTETIATLTFTLESTQHELERTRKEYLQMQLTSSEVKDENIQLMHRIEHLTKQRDDDASYRESSISKLRDAKVLVSDLQQQVAELSTRNDHLEESLGAALGRIEHSHTARDQAVEHSLQTDIRWRELEEMCKQLQLERNELQRMVESLDEKNQLLNERVKSLQQKDREWESAVQEDCERTVETYKLKMEDMSRQLEAARNKYDVDNDQQEDALKTATSQIEKLNLLLFKCREDLTARANENKALRESSESRCTQLETIVSEMREEKRIALQEEREELKAARKEIQKLRDQLITRGERYSVTVGAMHDAIHAIGGEASFLKGQFQYISSQQERMLVLMKELSKSQAVASIASDLIEPGDKQRSHPPQSALQTYGMEIQKTIRVLVSKVIETRDELESANHKINDQRNEIQTIKHICEEQDGKLVILQEKLSFSKGTIARLEKQCEEAVNSNKDLMSTMQQERERSSARLDKAEERVSDMIKQNTQSQTELMRVQSQLEASKRESDQRNSGLNKKFQKAVEDRDFYVEAAKNSDSKYNTLQDELMKAEAKIAKQQADFQKLKKISISMRDDIKKLTTQRTDQVAALSRALDQCRVQLDQKQQLIATLQAQRTEIMSSSRSPFDNVPFAASYSSSAGAPASSSRGAPEYTHRTAARPGGPSNTARMDIFRGTSRSSSSGARSSSNALSGLARLVHSHVTSSDDTLLSSSTQRWQPFNESESMTSSQRGTMSRVKAAKGDMDIGEGVFHSTLKHLSATVNQMDSDDYSLTFRAPALHPSLRDSPTVSEQSVDDMLTERAYRSQGKDVRTFDPLIDTSEDIFRLTSPSKLTKEISDPGEDSGDSGREFDSEYGDVSKRHSGE